VADAHLLGPLVRGEASNELYRTNLAKGQTGLSIAFDLPTQTGYDPDSRAGSRRGRQGRCARRAPRAHAHAARRIPPGAMNTSMTINATAAWLLALYVANAEEQGVPHHGAARHDAERHRQGVPVARHVHLPARAVSKRLIVDMVAWCAQHAPKWNPMNVCSYHLQEAGATPVQEIAFSLATAIDVLDAVRDSGQVDPSSSPRCSARISFFVNAGIRFVEEICKLRAFTELWDRIGLERYGVTDAKARRFRYGVQVNSLGLTEAQPENNVQRIVLEMLASPCRRGRGRAACSCRRGTRRSACPARGTSSGACACSRCSRSRPTCSSTATCSMGRWWWRRRPPSCAMPHGPNCRTCSRRVARSLRSTS
jgi:(2R)-ethylmalonyl-CoA mutase